MIPPALVALRMINWKLEYDALPFREAVFALAEIEEELCKDRKGVELSDLLQVVEGVMVNCPEYWQKHYHGSGPEVAYARKYSFSDRIRYYWPKPEVQGALSTLFKNLGQIEIPLTLLSQYMPTQYDAVRAGCSKRPVDLVHYKIMEVIRIYSKATQISRICMN